MTSRVPAILAALLSGVLVSAGCSSASSSNGHTGGTAVDDTAGSGSDGGRSAAGGANAPGRGGSGGRSAAGGANAAGRSGGGGGAQAGSSGSGGDQAGTGGGIGAAGMMGDPCGGCASGVCLPSGQCAECSLTDDQCPTGQYCSADNTCVAGCKTGAASCASGVCGADHDCQSCISDQECSAGRVCGNNQCQPPCTVAQEGGNDGCGIALTCCSLHCVDDGTDAQNCGGCGIACGAGQFCGVAGCRDSTISAVCSVAKVVVVLDGQDGDDAPGRAMAAALVTNCGSPPAVREVSQTTGDVENASNGRPVSGGDELLIVAGGAFYQHVSDYVSEQPIAPIYAAVEGSMFEYRDRATGTVVMSSASSEDYLHESFTIQFIRDPSSGSLILNAQGFWTSSTAAAALYFEQALLPVLDTVTESWYVGDWTDANADQTPQLSEITLVASGH